MKRVLFLMVGSMLVGAALGAAWDADGESGEHSSGPDYRASGFHQGPAGYGIRPGAEPGGGQFHAGSVAATAPRGRAAGGSADYRRYKETFRSGVGGFGDEPPHASGTDAPAVGGYRPRSIPAPRQEATGQWMEQPAEWGGREYASLPQPATDAVSTAGGGQGPGDSRHSEVYPGAGQAWDDGWGSGSNGYVPSNYSPAADGDVGRWATPAAPVVAPPPPPMPAWVKGYNTAPFYGGGVVQGGTQVAAVAPVGQWQPTLAPYGAVESVYPPLDNGPVQAGVAAWGGHGGAPSAYGVPQPGYVQVPQYVYVQVQQYPQYPQYAQPNVVQQPQPQPQPQYVAPRPVYGGYGNGGGTGGGPGYQGTYNPWGASAQPRYAGDSSASGW